MNTDPKTATSSDRKALSHPEQVLTNNKPVEHYQAKFHCTQHSQARVLIEAQSLAEALAKAQAINGEKVEEWEYLYAAKVYAHLSLRVARLLAWLDVALQRHEAQAYAEDYPWGYVASLERAEHDLKYLVAFMSATSMEELNRALVEGASHE